MIKYYLSAGDEEVGKVFTPYIWDKHGLGTLLDQTLRKDYGSDLVLLLIQYYIEGKFNSYVPIEPKLGNYMKKSKDIAVAIGVTSELFYKRNEFERREFIVDSTLEAINLVKERLAKKKLDTDFDKLLNDVREVVVDYLKRPEPYSPQPFLF